jgi:ABC-type phosphate/phosphonate transport system substrate-binding protein
LRLDVRTFDSYEGTSEALARGDGDAALLSPLLYVQMMDRFARDPGLRGVRLRLLATAVAGGSPTNVGYITAAADSSVRELSDVALWPFGMVEGSTSGYLYPIDLVDFRGLDPARLFARVRFYPNHADMMADLLRPAGERSIEAAALYQHMVDALEPEVRAKLRVIAKTGRIPRDAIVMRVPLVGGREDPRVLEVAGALQQALLEMDHDRGTARALRDGIGYDGWILGEDRRYDAVRKVYQRFGHYRFRGPEVEGAEGRARNE